MKLSFPNINYESLFRNYLELLLTTIIFTSTTRYFLLPLPRFSLFLLSWPWFTFTLLSKPFYLLPKPIFISTTLFLVLQPFHFFTFKNFFFYFLTFFNYNFSRYGRKCAKGVNACSPCITFNRVHFRGEL